MAQDCLFCKIVAGELPATKVFEDDRTVAFMDINPATRGHLLVVAPEDLAACAQAAQRLAGLAIERLGASGVNLLNSCGPVAWQTVFHFHLHVIRALRGTTIKGKKASIRRDRGYAPRHGR